MSLYGTALFAHVVFAILLVGGSSWAHVAGGMLQRSDTVAGARSHARFLAAFSKAAGPLAGIVLLAGIYMATDAGLWGDGWLLVSLVLFVAVGAASGIVVDPAVGRLVEVLDAAPDGPLTPAVRADLADPRLTTTLSLFAGSDLAFVFLMTNKPGLTGSLVVVAVALALGGAWAARELRTDGSAAGAAAA